MVWQTTIPLDDCFELFTYNLELEVIYSQNIITPRPDNKGYRLKIAEINKPKVKLAEHYYNNVEPNKPTDNKLVIDGKSVPMTALYFIEVADE